MKQKLFTLLTLLCFAVSGAWADGTAISQLNFNSPSVLPANYTYSSTNTPVIVSDVDSKNVVNVTNGGNSGVPTFSADNSTAPTGGKRWMAFKPAEDCTVSFKVRSTNAGRIMYLWDKDNKATDDAVSTFTISAKNTWYDTWSVDLTGGTWYVIGGSGSSCYITSMTFASSTTYAITWNKGGHGTAPTSPTSGSTFVLPTMDPADGYVNTGWTANVAVTYNEASRAAGYEFPVGGTVTLSQATTFTGVWKAPSTFALTSDAEVEIAKDGTSTITYENNAGTVTFESADESIATVSSSGVIEGVAGGKTTITVTDPGSAEVAGGSATVTVLVPYPNPSAATSYVLNQDTYAFSNAANTKYYFTNGFTIDVTGGGAEFQNGGLANSKKYSHARSYTINVPSTVTVTYAVFTARNNYASGAGAASNWGTVFGTDYSATALPWSTEDPAEKDFVIASPSAGGTLAFTPGGNQWQAILTLYTDTYHAKYTVSYDAGEGSGSMDGSVVRGGTIFALPNSTFTAPASKGFAGWRCSVDGKIYAAGANYPMTDANTTFTALYAGYDGSSIIKATVTSNTAATVTGSIGGTSTVALQNSSVDGGYKFGSNYDHISLTLAGGETFQTGDIINVYITQVADIAGGKLIFYNADKSVIWDTEEVGVVGDNKFTLPAAADGKTEIYVYRIKTPGTGETKNDWNAYVKFIEVTRPISGTISALGWNTFSCAYPLDLSTITGGTAYYASAASGSNVTLTSTTATVPAGEGLMIKGTAGETFKINSASSGTAISGNKMVGLPYGATVAKAGTGCNYVFGWADPADPGFYLINGESATLGAGKAYLHTTGELTEGRLAIVFDEEGDVTGIANVSNKKQNNGEYYNLNGQRVDASHKGIVIVNGKKFFNK